MGAWADFMIAVIIIGFLLAIAVLFLKPEEMAKQEEVAKQVKPTEVAKQVEPTEVAKQEVTKEGRHKKHK